MSGRVWQGVLSLLSVPFVIQLLGTESFGIVGFVQSLQAFLGLLDMGLAATVTREVAVRRRSEERVQVANIVRTFEWVYWPVGFLIALVVVGASGWLSNSWVTRQSLSPADIQMAVILGGVTLAARWPVALYTGILRGLERQMLLNMILMAAAGVRLLAGISALLFISRSVSCFLISQAAVNIAEALATGYCARAITDPSSMGRFKISELQRVWRFALSFNLVGACGTISAAADKMWIAKLLPLTAMTYYSVCATATGLLLLVYQAAAVSLFPRFTYCWHCRDLAEMSRLYLLSLRLSTYLCLGPLIALLFFPRDLLVLWTCSEEIADAGSTVLPIMTVAIMLNCFSAITYDILIATGCTRIPLVLNLAFVPANWVCMYAAIDRTGLPGAAWCNIGVNLVYFVIYGTFCRVRILRDHSVSVFFGLPVRLIALAGVCGGVSKVATGEHCTILQRIGGAAAAITVFYVVGLALMSCNERRLILETLYRLCGYIMRVIVPRQTKTVP